MMSYREASTKMRHLGQWIILCVALSLPCTVIVGLFHGAFIAAIFLIVIWAGIFVVQKIHKIPLTIAMDERLELVESFINPFLERWGQEAKRMGFSPDAPKPIDVYAQASFILATIRSEGIPLDEIVLNERLCDDLQQHAQFYWSIINV